MAAPPILVAVNFNRTTKMTSDLPNSEWWKFNNGFTNCKFNNILEFHEVIKRGHSFCPCHAHIHRPTRRMDGTEGMTAFRHHDNYIDCNTIGLDFDAGDTDLKTLEQHDFFHKYGSYAYTTVSSKPEPGLWRVRAVFVLEKPIVKLANFRIAKRVIGDLYPTTDKSDRNVVHAYAGNATPNLMYIKAPEAYLPMQVLFALIEAHQREEERVRAAKVQRVQERATVAGHEDFPTLADVEEMLDHIPVAGEYMQWFKTLVAVLDKFPDEDGIEVLERWSLGYPGYVYGTVGRKMHSYQRTADSPSIDWLVARAISHGYDTPAWRQKQEEKRVREEERRFATLAAAAIRYGR